MTSPHATQSVRCAGIPNTAGFFAAAFATEWPLGMALVGQAAPGESPRVRGAKGELPVGVIAAGPNNRPLGVAALKATSFQASHCLLAWASVVTSFAVAASKMWCLSSACCRRPRGVGYKSVLFAPQEQPGVAAQARLGLIEANLSPEGHPACRSVPLCGATRNATSTLLERLAAGDASPRAEASCHHPSRGPAPWRLPLQLQTVEASCQRITAATARNLKPAKHQRSAWTLSRLLI